MKYDQIKIIHCDLFIQQSLYLTSSQNFKLLKKTANIKYWNVMINTINLTIWQNITISTPLQLV